MLGISEKAHMWMAMVAMVVMVPCSAWNNVMRLQQARGPGLESGVALHPCVQSGRNLSLVEKPLPKVAPVQVTKTCEMQSASHLLVSTMWPYASLP